MITKNSKIRSNIRTWPYTPEPSPPLGPTLTEVVIDEEFIMASDDPSKSRPISMTTKLQGSHSQHGRPTLDDVLSGRAPAPYTLAAYTAFLSQQHCLETLEFVTESRKYGEKYDMAAAEFAGMPLNIETDSGFELIQDWMRLMDVYVKPGAPREINLPSEERDDLVEEPFDPRPPPPECLEPAIRRMYDLMSDSIFIPFCNSLRPSTHAQTYNALPQFGQDKDSLAPSRLTYDERSIATHRHSTQSKRSSSGTSAFQPSRSPPEQRHSSTRTSTLTSALSRAGSAKLSTHLSHSSAVSESALTDDSASAGSPSAGDIESSSPPLTPPASDLPVSHSSQSQASHAPKNTRSDSGGWKKMGMKIFGAPKKKRGGGLSQD